MDIDEKKYYAARKKSKELKQDNITYRNLLDQNEKQIKENEEALLCAGLRYYDKNRRMDIVKRAKQSCVVPQNDITEMEDYLDAKKWTIDNVNIRIIDLYYDIDTATRKNKNYSLRGFIEFLGGGNCNNDN